MNNISKTSLNAKTQPQLKGSWNYCRDFASILCSRESTYRGALDITGLDLPLIVADLFRSFKKAMESAFEGLSGTTMVVIAPLLTTYVGRIQAEFILPKEMQKDVLHYLKFSMSELRDFKNFETAINRIKIEETEDKHFISSLYSRTGKEDLAEKYKMQAKEIEDFYDNFVATEEKQKLIYKLKKATIIGESLIEGCYWGSFGLIMRLFRKYVLGENRFTGTMNYASEEESSNLGESKELTIFQKAVGVGSIFISPVLNSYLLTKVEDKEAVQKSKFLQIVQNQFDMTHGIYPKLGLLFSMTSLPKWISAIVTSQGWYERTERILKLLTVIPSWWLGHRITNGTFALNADKELSGKFNVQPGILVEPEYLSQTKNGTESYFERIQKSFPEPAKIHHVIKSTEGNEKLQNEAEDAHAKCLYKGFAAHSLMVWIINMGVNYVTKLRIKHALEN